MITKAIMISRQFHALPASTDHPFLKAVPLPFGDLCDYTDRHRLFL